MLLSTLALLSLAPPPLSVAADLYRSTVVAGEPILFRASIQNDSERDVFAKAADRERWLRAQLDPDSTIPTPSLTLPPLEQPPVRPSNVVDGPVYTGIVTVERRHGREAVFYIPTPTSLPPGKYALQMEWDLPYYGSFGRAEPSLGSVVGMRRLEVVVKPYDAIALRQAAFALKERVSDQLWKGTTVHSMSQPAADALFSMDPTSASPAWSELAGTEERMDRNGALGTIRPSLELFDGLSRRNTPEAVRAYAQVVRRARRNQTATWPMDTERVAKAFARFEASGNPQVVRAVRAERAALTAEGVSRD